MGDLEALYLTIVANPHDDTVRLVYADALQDRGQDDVANFIRGQINGTIPPIRYGVARRGLSTKLFAHKPYPPIGIKWKKGSRYKIRPLLIPVPRWVIVDRGFPSWISLTLSQWAENHERLIGSAPITHVGLYAAGFVGSWHTVNGQEVGSGWHLFAESGMVIVPWDTPTDDRSIRSPQFAKLFAERWPSITLAEPDEFHRMVPYLASESQFRA